MVFRKIPMKGEKIKGRRIKWTPIGRSEIVFDFSAVGPSGNYPNGAAF